LAEAEAHAEGASAAETSLTSPAPAPTLHETRIHSSLHRARTKTFVRMAKPFRRLFRNQGAVNDSLIEAVHHLAAQNEEMLQQIEDLKGVVNGLRNQLRRVPQHEPRSALATRSDASNTKA
jgi:hypothetical protein